MGLWAANQLRCAELPDLGGLVRRKRWRGPPVNAGQRRRSAHHSRRCLFIRSIHFLGCGNRGVFLCALHAICSGACVQPINIGGIGDARNSSLSPAAERVQSLELLLMFTAALLWLV